MRSRFVLAGIFLALAFGQSGTRVASAAQIPGAGSEGVQQEKRFAFEMRSQPWTKVFDWLSDQTGLPFVSLRVPPGAFTARTLKQDQTYTLTQIIDMINEELLSQNYLLIRRESAFTVRPADEPVDPIFVPLVEIENLASRGRTELARVVLPLKNLQAREVLAEVKKHMGPFGTVTATSPNNLVLLDTAGNLKQIVKLVQDSAPGDATETLAHVCVFVRATYAQKIIQELLTSRRPAKGQPAPQFVRISTDQRTNTVFVSGAAEHIAQAKAVLAKIDVAAQGSPRLALGPHLLKTYSVAAGNARAVAEALQRIFRGETDVEITALSNNQILVWADPEDQLAVARHLIELQPAPLATEVISLATLPPAKTAETLRSMFGATRSGGGGVPFIEADHARNALIVKASKEQLDDIRSTLRSLGEGAPAGSARTFSVERGDAASLAEALERLLKDMRPNPVRVIMPEQKGGPALKGKDKGGAPKKETSKAAGEITMTVVANKLIVACEDPQALALAQELVRMLTAAPGGDAEGKYEVVKLRHAIAAEVAAVLDKAFNGPGKAAVERVRIVADPATNALLIKASPLDLLTVRRLLSSALDAEEADAGAPPQIRIIGPLKNAKAREVVTILRDIFGARPDDKTSAAVKGGPRFSVDERTNSIVVQCSHALQLEIDSLVTRLDEKQ